MITVVLAGGSGTRLWPLSTPDNPKHLLKVNGEQSLLQDAYARARLCGDDVYVATDASHADLVREQLTDELDEEHIIVEPDRRGTASCMVLALARLAAVCGEDITVGFIHADHHILDKEAFAQTVQAAAGCASTYQSLALIGIQPNYPATGFGYIKRGERLDGCYRVTAFEEKPGPETAEGYVENGRYLWNLGLFSAPARVFTREMARHNPDLHDAYERLKNLIIEGKSYEVTYLELPGQNIEPAVTERSQNVVVVPGEFDWADIGSFKDLHETLPKSDEHANAVEGEAVCIDTHESIVMEYTGRPVAVMGLENVVVISTEKGLLVCHKEYSQRVKEAAEVFNDSQEEKRDPSG